MIDQTGRVLPELKAALEPAAISQRRAQILAQALQNGGPPGVMGRPPVLTVNALAVSAQATHEKSWLIQPRGAHPRHLALVVIPADAVTLGEGGRQYGTYQLYPVF